MRGRRRHRALGLAGVIVGGCWALGAVFFYALPGYLGLIVEGSPLTFRWTGWLPGVLPFADLVGSVTLVWVGIDELRQRSPGVIRATIQLLGLIAGIGVVLFFLWSVARDLTATSRVVETLTWGVGSLVTLGVAVPFVTTRARICLRAFTRGRRRE